MLQEGLFSFSEKNGWFSSNAIANMAYFVFIHAYRYRNISIPVCVNEHKIGHVCTLTSRREVDCSSKSVYLFHSNTYRYG